MRAYIEVWGRSGPELFAIEDKQTTLGRSSSMSICLSFDATVSDVHAVLESFGTWVVLRDMGSTNGTFVNGERLTGERRLRAGDEIRLGQTRLVFRTQGEEKTDVTAPAEDPPDLTRRERDVLIALCRPMLSEQAFAQPASIREMARDLVVSEAAVKFHLANLYDKFGLLETTQSRRVRLANEAVRRRAVSVADLRG